MEDKFPSRLVIATLVKVAVSKSMLATIQPTAELEGRSILPLVTVLASYSQMAATVEQSQSAAAVRLVATLGIAVALSQSQEEAQRMGWAARCSSRVGHLNSSQPENFDWSPQMLEFEEKAVVSPCLRG